MAIIEMSFNEDLRVGYISDTDAEDGDKAD
jgi:hypothetical protein